MCRRILFSVLTLLLCSWTATAERQATSGSFTIDLDNPPPDVIRAGVPWGARSNVLVNGDFEGGSLAPWTTQAWTISTNGPHAGTYCAFDIGNNWITQTFAPVDVSLVQSVSLWERQPEVSISAVDFYYSPTDYDEFLLFLPNANWSFFDLTALLRAAGNLQGLRIWGYSGGGSAPDETYLDDVLIDVSFTPIEEGTWGSIKALFR